MKSKMKSFPVSSFVLLILFQVAVGLLGFVISGKLSQFSWLINMLLLWLGVTLGMYLGGVPFLLQKTFSPKKSLARFATTALGASIPVLLLILLGFESGIQNTVYVAVAPIFALLALVLGLFGFFIPGWFPNKSPVA